MQSHVCVRTRPHESLGNSQNDENVGEGGGCGDEHIRPIEPTFDFNLKRWRLKLFFPIHVVLIIRSVNM